jgi:hypothetical protein
MQPKLSKLGWAPFMGISMMVLSKIKYHTSPYTPKPDDQFDTRISYDLGVVDEWLKYAKSYAPHFVLKGKNVLELGPGSDLGTACVLLARGAKTYVAYDVHNVAANQPRKLYESLLEKNGKESFDSLYTSNEIAGFATNPSSDGSGAISYIVRPGLDCERIEDSSVDAVFSQAALEHFQDIDVSLGLLSRKCKSGSIFVAEVDLKAHSRWVRDHDPLHIYTVNDFLYKALSHKASPNRVRPREYKGFLANNGWSNIQVFKLSVASDDYISSVRKRVLPRYIDNDIGSLSIMICATKL